MFEVEAHARRASLLAEASMVLANQLDEETMLRKVTALVIPSFADGCCAYLRDDEGLVRLAAVHHGDPERAEKAQRAVEKSDSMPADPHSLKVLDTGVAEIVSGSDCPMLVVPLAVHGRTFGALSLTRGSEGLPYETAELHLAEEIGRRVAMAIDHYHLFDLANRERARAEEANRAKDEFLAMVSHELRTPLNAILGWARMLKSGALDTEKRGKAIDTIERSARVQAQLIDDLLDVSRIITGKLRVDLDVVDLPRVVVAAVDTVRPTADAKEVGLQLSIEPGAGAISGDPNRLQQVVWNLVHNAVKFTHKGGNVSVTLRRRDDHAEVLVEDTGQGIAREFLPHVFERFRQADGGTTRRKGGLGLGLAIVRHLVELHGGDVSADSQGEGAGSTFSVRLPVTARTPASGPASIAPSVRLEPREARNDIEGLRVLVVDDEPDARDLLASVLDRHKAVVRTAATVSEALCVLAEWRAEVLVSDVGMPNEDGYSLIQRIRKLPREGGGAIPAVALTAYSRIEDRTRALLAGFNMHVPKPVEPAELIVVLATVSGRLGP